MIFWNHNMTIMSNGVVNYNEPQIGKIIDAAFSVTIICCWHISWRTFIRLQMQKRRTDNTKMSSRGLIDWKFGSVYLKCYFTMECFTRYSITLVRRLRFEGECGVSFLSQSILIIATLSPFSN